MPCSKCGRKKSEREREQSAIQRREQAAKVKANAPSRARIIAQVKAQRGSNG